MLRMVICCLGGFSSSLMTQRMQDEIKKNHLEDKVSINYRPFSKFRTTMDEFDIALLCPHLLYYAKQISEAGEPTIPMYILPSRIYGMMDLRILVEDAIDIIKLYKEKPVNPIHFPDEDYLVKDRYTSHRQWLKYHKK